MLVCDICMNPETPNNPMAVKSQYITIGVVRPGASLMSQPKLFNRPADFCKDCKALLDVFDWAGIAARSNQSLMKQLGIPEAPNAR